MRKALDVYLTREMLVVLVLGFSAGLPLALTGSTLQAWMTSEGVDITVIGVFTLVGIPYTLKFLWSPFVDRYRFPFLGRRRGWILVSQIGVAASVASYALVSPGHNPWLVGFFALMVAFWSATQDIAFDAYRTELLTEEERGPGSGVYVMGYRFGMIFSGALGLYLADHLPWGMTFLLMAASVGIGVAGTLIARENQAPANAPHSMQDAIVLPLRNFFERKGSLEVFLFMIIYKLDWAMVLALSTTFLLQLGFTKTEIAQVSKAFGMIAVILGALGGGALMLRMALKTALFWFGIVQALAGLSFLLLAMWGKSYGLLVFAIFIENFSGGLSIAAFSAFMMSLCEKRFAATQYALLSSLMALSRYIAGAPSGFMVKAWGWETYFVICTVIGFPSLLMLARFDRWRRPG